MSRLSSQLADETVDDTRAVDGTVDEIDGTRDDTRARGWDGVRTTA